MRKDIRLTEDEVNKIVDDLLNDTTLSSGEKQILIKYKRGKNEYFLKKILELKINVLQYQLEHGLTSLSSNMLEFYTEICRQYPTTWGFPAIFNGLIRKKHK